MSILIFCVFSSGLFLLNVLSHSDLFVFLYFYCIILYLLFSFLTSDRKRVDLVERRGGKELEGVGGGKKAIRIYCMKKTVFSKRKK